MPDEEQAAVYLKRRGEYQAIIAECKGLREAILQHADSYEALAKALRKDMDWQTWDRQGLIRSAEDLCDQIERYQKLLGEKADKKARLEPFGETFVPLEP